jgi:hypothetical protein
MGRAAPANDLESPAVFAILFVPRGIGSRWVASGAGDERNSSHCPLRRFRAMTQQSGRFDGISRDTGADQAIR